ncbi:protein translocase subunit SecF [candidate division WWE3 bacterium CG_4_10_14_0_2_um_filter_41_14]|uniref:Protein-export membrane protein SecF n=1 Tax=candidate division WWE3 bacterium CG_4_10_14_0_2_um_filter_41_14 TaxID=1975072 RepID=A0A2M7TIJ4_UNCKA|nr:MAG: protein translocase subunit SecF [candidate division WWE3 bacterium CG_4_10_14_0_2_um_filter_41_14]
MINFIKRTNLFLIISSVTIVVSLLLVLVFGLKPGIDFTGGTVVQISGVTTQDGSEVSKDEVSHILSDQGVDVVSVITTSTGFELRFKETSQEQWTPVSDVFAQTYAGYVQDSFQTVGPVLGQELVRKTLFAVILSSISLLFYIAWRFKDRVFGIAAVIALIHDVLVILGTFALLGNLLNVEVDVMFVTATLTALAFSVHDTIVLFDRVREVKRRQPKDDFETVMNTAINSTLVRSLSTSLSIAFVLIALLVLGGTVIRWFVVALLVGTISGAYSSPFTAAPLTVFWHRWKKNKSATTRSRNT